MRRRRRAARGIQIDCDGGNMRSLPAERLRVRACSGSDSRSAWGAPPHLRLDVIFVSHASGVGNRRWRGSEMDERRFDALTRILSHATSRRGALRRLGLAGAGAAAAGIFGRRQTATAHHCSYEGCGCATGTQHACGSGLVCCASSPGMPGGGGICTPRAQCGGGCADRGTACPGYCNRGDGCSGCCSGYCGTHGACDQPPNLGLSCTGGTVNPCLNGLICCPYVPGLAGGAGVCEYRC